MSEPQKDNRADSILKNLSVLYLVLITWGFIYNYVFYRNFGINIAEYIDISEGFAFCIPILVNPLIVLIVLGSFYFVYGENLLSSDNPAGQKSTKWFNITVFLFLSVIMVFGLILEKESWVHPNFYLPIVLLVLFFLQPLIRLTAGNFHIKFSGNFIHLLSVFILGLFVVILMSISKVRKIKKFRKYQNCEILFKNMDKSFISDSSQYYIGRTKSFIFLYYDSLHTTRVLNVDDIKEVKLSE